MNTISQYSSKLNIIREIPDDKILIPVSIPVSIYLQEAENLYNWCLPDKGILTASGLNWQFVEDLPARIDTLREAQARWTASDSTDIEIEKKWNIKSAEAHQLRKQLVRSLKFILRHNPAAFSKIKKFEGSESNAAMIQALRDISVFAGEHSEILSASGFDITSLDRAGEMSREIASLLGEVNSKRAFCSGTLKTRNQAYTHLREAVTEIKEHADFALWREPDRLKGYRSGYYRRKHLNRKNRKETTDEVKS